MIRDASIIVFPAIQPIRIAARSPSLPVAACKHRCFLLTLSANQDPRPAHIVGQRLTIIRAQLTLTDNSRLGKTNVFLNPAGDGRPRATSSLPAFDRELHGCWNRVHGVEWPQDTPRSSQYAHSANSAIRAPAFSCSPAGRDPKDGFQRRQDGSRCRPAIQSSPGDCQSAHSTTTGAAIQEGQTRQIMLTEVRHLFLKVTKQCPDLGRGRSRATTVNGGTGGGGGQEKVSAYSFLTATNTTLGRS